MENIVLQSLRIFYTLYYARKSVTTMWKCGNAFSPRKTKVYQIRNLYITIFSTFYNILQPYFTVSLNLGSSFQLCENRFPI